MQSYWSYSAGQCDYSEQLLPVHLSCRIPINLHSIINSGLIPGAQNLSHRQTVFFLPVDLMDKNHKDPVTIDLEAPRLAQYMHKAWKKHQNTVYWVDINLAVRKGLKFYQTRSNAIILHETLPAYCIPKVVRIYTGEVIYEKVYMSPRPPPKISLKHDWKRELGSEHAQRPEVGQLSRSFQSNQPIPNPSRERTGRPVVKDDTRTVQDGRKTSRSQEIDVNSFHEDTVFFGKTGRPVVETSAIRTRSSEDSKDPHVEKAHERTRRLVVETNTENVPDDCQTRSCHESKTFNVGDKTLREGTGRPVVNHDETSHEKTMLNEVNMDFRIPGLPHSVVKHAQSTSVRELIQKIENHPDRHAVQQDLRQNQAYNPFSPESKKMIQEVGNIELFELLGTDPKTQCTACLSYYSRRNQFERFRGFLELISRFEFEFRRRENYFFWTIRIFGAFMWMCRGLFVPTQFHFECCGFLDGSWWQIYTFQWNHCGRS